MAASAKVDGVGTVPIALSDSTGAQKSVPLSAQTFSGSKPDIADDWATEFNQAADKTTVFAVATRVAADELTPDRRHPPPARPTRWHTTASTSANET
jgi:hypothetical protein